MGVSRGRMLHKAIFFRIRTRFDLPRACYRQRRVFFGSFPSPPPARTFTRLRAPPNRVDGAAGKLHTGRSRHDQVATDFRLWILGAIPALDTMLKDLQSAFVEQAELAGETLMPGYTHLQRAQPILLAHWWLSHYHPLRRDRERLNDLTARVSVMPLGSGAFWHTVPWTALLAESLAIAPAQ